MNDLYDVLRQVVQLFDELQLPYVVMGGIAARVLGIPRPTFDLDFTLAAEGDQLFRLFDRLEQCGLTVPEIYRTGWTDRVADMPLVKARLYIEGKGVDVDLFLLQSSFQKSILGRRERQNIDGIGVWLVTPEDLILLKLIAGRPRDLVDIGDVLFMQGQLDLAYMRHWAKLLGVEASLEKALVDARSQSS